RRWGAPGASVEMMTRRPARGSAIAADPSDMMAFMGAATAVATRLAGGGLLRADERELVGTAGLVFGLASAGAAMTASAADAMFLASIGSAHLGHAVAVSSALLAVVLVVVGGLS